MEQIENRSRRSAPLVSVPGGGDFTSLYEREYVAAVRLAYLLCSNQETARDIAQDAFVGLHRKWNDVDDPRAYLRRSIVNGSNSWLRRRRTRDRTALPVPDDVVQDADELSDVLGGLPHRQRAAVILRFHHQCTHDEIAVALGCRPGTVGSLLSRALTRLRKELS
ncbi:RNA polymerase sigma factor [Actinospongicola halichondriae]|uniref:RNA polymerase sigma factor n=1 Tax=Actinospongicola halichondriae TaxID=3236844 RepID=UPI003D3F07FA